MKRRLRKKKFLGEFKVFGAPLAIKRNTTSEMDDFIDALLQEAIEANHCIACIGGHADMLDGFIELGTQDNNPEQALARINEWLKQRSDIERFFVGEIIDAEYGPFDEVDQIAHKL
ncbi:50S ribosome-binding protein YggL [Dongshaea marina]|uniref:50S ribosome-binding protein YggL n=1 Tax=Dongshaea marina TaxID=2047966 RepID=UPI00131F1D46|nr:50S ribosome-binding protein YggL [Dongshaea marina]